MVHECVGVHHGDQLVQKISLGFEELRGQFLHDPLQLFSSITRSSIPCLGLPPGNMATIKSKTPLAIHPQKYA